VYHNAAPSATAKMKAVHVHFNGGKLSDAETVLLRQPGGSPFVIARRRGIFDQLTDGRNTNLGTLFKKYILRAGETPWPKPFHAMPSREVILIREGVSWKL